MSYIDAYTINDEVIVWERSSEGARTIKKYPAPYYFFYETDESDSTDISMYNKPLKRVTATNRREFAKLKDKYISMGCKLYESDIRPEMKILSDYYYKVPEPKLHITLFDIEVDYDPLRGFSSTENPYAPINAVSIHHHWLKKSIVYAVPPKGWDPTSYNTELDKLSEVVFCENERELLICLMNEFRESDIISGWNSALFDLPYITKRLELLGEKYVNKLCFTGAQPPRYREFMGKFGTMCVTVELSGRQHLDYMELFKKYEVSDRPSYKLESIAEEILPDLPKLHYDGTLAELYHNDFNHFIRYNIRDTEILAGFENVLEYISLANVMAHSSTCKINQVLGTIKLAEQSIINFCHYERGNLKVPDWEEKEDSSIEGAYVLLPQIGMHYWVSDVDVSSLYPSTIRTINISPETIIGQFVNFHIAWQEIFKSSERDLTLKYENGQLATKSATEWREYLLDNLYSISAYGTVFDLKQAGIIPSILTSWYAQRKEFQHLHEQYTNLAETTDDPLLKQEYKDKALYYDKQQYVRKIQLNSTYGAMSNIFFRFYDTRLSASTTYSGKQISLHQHRIIGKLLDGNYDFTPPVSEEELLALDGKFPSESILAGDTDSCYFLTHATCKDEAIEVAKLVANKANKSFPEFTKKAFLVTSDYCTFIKSDWEVISDVAIFVKKKKYIMHLVSMKGHDVDKIKIAGLDFKKTTLPKWVSARLLTLMKMILNDNPDWDQFDNQVVAFKREIKANIHAKLSDTDRYTVLDIGLPMGVKKVEHYTRELQLSDKVRVPGHVRASIMWNEMLSQYNDLESIKIVSGTKIKVYKLTRPFGKFKSIAVPTDMTTLPEWFVNDFVDIIDVDAQIEHLIDNTLNNTLKAMGRKAGTELSLLFNESFNVTTRRGRK